MKFQRKILEWVVGVDGCPCTCLKLWKWMCVGPLVEKADLDNLLIFSG